MASLSLRSSKKIESLTTRSSARNNVREAPGISNHTPTQQLSNIRKKRSRESAEDAEHSLTIKKARLMVEISSKAKPPAIQTVVVNGGAIHHPRLSPVPDSKRTAARSTQTPPIPRPQHINHQQKLVNGIKHELNRLGPNVEDLKAAEQKEQKRSLRSQEGLRFKSDLSTYFPEYDEVIGNDPKEEHILNYDTPIIIIDSAKASTKLQTNGQIHEDSFKEFTDNLFETLNNAERVDFSFLAQHYRDEKDDPLSIAYFESIHQRPEREAKKVRNGDKNKAQHERNEIIRLMEGLKGHEWLKVMGVSGITESRKKDYELARQHFVTGCEAILEKFRTWKEEEKRRKIEKEQAKAGSVAEAREESVVSNGDPPDYSDVDASAARQLHEEAIAMCGPNKKTERRAKVHAISPPTADKIEPDLKSFFSKKHNRDQISKLRRSGRSSGAWGYPIPDVPNSDFDLPEELRDEDSLRAHARKKRRERRINKA